MDKEQLTGNIRHRYRDLDVSLDASHPEKAYAQYVSAAPVTPLGHFETSVGTSPSGLPSLLLEARRVVITAITNPVTFTDDGTAPSATHGMIIPAGTIFVYDTDPDANFQMWASTATNVRVAYYG